MKKKYRIINRIKSRNDNKILDEKWIENIIRDYHFPNEELMSMFGSVENITSDGYNYIIRKYL